MIKFIEKKAAPTTTPAACCIISNQPSLGIEFVKKDGERRFAPYSFLVRADRIANGEMKFHFTSWEVILRGDALQPLWEAVCEGCLSQVRELDQVREADGPWVHELVFRESIQDFPFPTEHESLPKR